MQGFEVYSNESVCRKSGRLGLEQIFSGNIKQRIMGSIHDV